MTSERGQDDLVVYLLRKDVFVCVYAEITAKINNQQVLVDPVFQYAGFFVLIMKTECSSMIAN